ncbi:MAG TPA: flavodoxin family protein [Methanobacterium sp.]|nr:flavodoxin family protein [Methanobacterium sp.]
MNVVDRIKNRELMGKSMPPEKLTHDKLKFKTLSKQHSTAKEYTVKPLKVLAIMGSPRKKGNTYKLTRKVEEKMKQLGNVEFEYLFLKDVNLQPCKGCFLCIPKNENLCPLKDDLAEIEKRIMESDGVILTSPVYALQISWLMKILVDRLAYLFHRPRYFGKSAMAISTTGGLGLKETLNYLEVVAEGWGLNFVCKLGIETPPWPKTSKSNKRNEKKIHNTAKTFYDSLGSKKLQNPSLRKYIGFKIVKGLSERLKEYLQADYQFYKNRENYYYDMEIGVFKKIGAWLMLKIGFFMMRDNFVENKKE